MPAQNKTSSGDKRQRIILAAMSVFSRKGFHKAKVEEIAEEADIGKGTVYEYFASKKELFQEMLVYVNDHYQEKAALKLNQVESFHDGLHKLFAFAVQITREHKEMALILISDHPLFDEDFHEIIMKKEQQRLDALANFLQSLMRREEAEVGRLRPGINVHAASLTILGALYAICSRIIFHDSEEDIDFEVLARDAVDIVLHGLVEK